MTWQWVTLILGICFMLFVLIGLVSWMNMKTEMFKAIPRTIPDLMKSTKPEAEDTLVEAKWPQGFTGGEDASTQEQGRVPVR